jgi:histidine ammonia-lyase
VFKKKKRRQFVRIYKNKITMKNIHYISSDQLDIETINKIISEKYSITLSSESRNNIVKCRQYLDKLLENNPPPIYGINTGFGSLCNKVVAPEDYSELQEIL